MDEPKPKRKYEKLTPEVLERRAEEKRLKSESARPKGRPATGRKEKYSRELPWKPIKDADRPEVLAIRIRFDKVFQYLLDNYETPGIVGIKTDYAFCRDNKLRVEYFYPLRQNPRLTPSYFVLIVLIEKHKVNAEWLLTGKGKMMKP